MSTAITWIHIGDLHLDEADAWQSGDALKQIVAQVNAHAGKGVDFVFLPGDNANHGTPAQYAVLIDSLAPLCLPWRIIPGDHDFEPRDLANYRDAIPKPNRPESELISGHRCIFLDLVSAGAGGPDFRLTMHDRNRIAEELSRAEAWNEVPLVFMHAYPGDLAADGEDVARTLADGRVAFVDTGHTHYSELLNDGRVIYGATRSTGQIEEDDGRVGFSVVCIWNRIPSWRFRRLDAPWPHVQIVAPCDVRLVTRPADALQVPRPGAVTIVAKVLGISDGTEVSVRVGGAPSVAMEPSDNGFWQACVTIDEEGLHMVEVTCGHVQDRIDLLVRGAEAIPKRRTPSALGTDSHTIGAWPTAGIPGNQLGPNKNGRGW